MSATKRLFELGQYKTLKNEIICPTSCGILIVRLDFPSIWINGEAHRLIELSYLSNLLALYFLIIFLAACTISVSALLLIEGTPLSLSK